MTVVCHEGITTHSTFLMRIVTVGTHVVVTQYRLISKGNIFRHDHHLTTQPGPPLI